MLRSIQPDETLRPNVAQFGPVIRWLRDHGLSRSRLASLFETTVENIGVIAHRAQPVFEGRQPAPVFGTRSFNEIVSRELSFEETEPVRTRAEARNADELREALEETARRYGSNYRFLEGLAELNRLRPLLGRPRDILRTRLLARFHYHRAWFSTNCGLDASSIREANRAFSLAADLYRRSGSPDELQQMSSAALLASNSYLARNDVEEARRCLTLVRQATERARRPLDSAYYLQLGGADFQELADDEARRNYAKAHELWQANSNVDVSIIGTRQLNLLAPVSWDRSREVLMLVRERFSPESLEASINVNWTAACAFSTDSPAAHRIAQELLETHRERALDFGAQSTTSELLGLTPLLAPPFQPSFARFVLSQNAFRNR